MAYRDARLQIPHPDHVDAVSQFGADRALRSVSGSSTAQVRIISPTWAEDSAIGAYLCREEVALGWLAMQVDSPVRWLEDCREHLVKQTRIPASTPLRDHRLRRRRGQAPRHRLRRACRCRCLFVLSNLVRPGGRADRQPAARAVRSSTPSGAAPMRWRPTVPIIPYRGGGAQAAFASPSRW